jgi:hypothetical protein
VSAAVLAATATGCGKSTPPTPPEPPKPEVSVQPALPAAKPVQLAELSPVTLDPGAGVKVSLQVERGGNTGPIQVELADVPAGVSVKPITIPAGESAGQLELAAGEKLGDSELKATLRVTARLGEQKAERPLALVVNKLKIPKLVAPPEVVVQPGATAFVDLTVERNGYPGPIALKAEGVPAKVRATVLNVAAGQSAAKMRIAAEADAPDGRHTLRVATTAYGRTIEAQVPLVIERFPYRVNCFTVVTLKPGETKSVSIPIEWRTFKGPLRLDVADLPEGVTAARVVVAPDQSAAKLELSGAKDARERVRSARVLSAGGDYSGADPIIVRVSRGQQGFLPQEITGNPALIHLLRRGGFGGRVSAQTKKALLEAYGGTRESEAAVLRGLKWLADHQQSDGRWSLKNYSKDISDCDCLGKLDAEVVDIDVAGTAFAVLPFLGAGVTHSQAPEEPAELGQYKKVVKKALTFLLKSQGQVINKDPLQDGKLHDNMYAHALATIALCEAYGLSNETALKVAAQRAIKYLVESQDPEGGGWRYGRRQPGDMSAVGWVFLAVRGGNLAGLTLKRTPLMRAQGFVDSCAAGPKESKLSRYGYQPGTPATVALSAAGLLTRQYLGWSKDNPDLAAGCQYLMENLPPDSGDQLGPIYYYYYATQVLHHMEGSSFDLWNHRMRELLIRTQEKKGHKAGSWSPEGADWGKQAGRLYSTSLALMTLEVYYRHLPMYRMLVFAPSTQLMIR